MAGRGVLALGLLASVANGAAGGASFYPEGHFDRVEKISEYGSFLDYIDEQVEQEKTVFVRWIASEGNDVTRLFAGNKDVAFADVNLKESPMIRGDELGPPGAGGWPTIRYFTKKTGQFGDAYQKVTDLSMCSELGDRMHMIDYVEDYSGTVLCGLDGTNCDEREIKYAEKWKVASTEEVQSQLQRLEDLTSKPMNEDLLEWAWRRMRILKRILAAADDSGGGSSSESAGAEL